MKKILLVDDDKVFLESLETMLLEEGYSVQKESNPVVVSEKIGSLSYDAALFDIKMPGMNGIDLMQKIKPYNISSPIIFISGQSTISIAVDAIKLGAYDFVEKPVDPERLLLTLKNALTSKCLTRENENIFNELKSTNKIIGNSRSTKLLIDEIKHIAPTNAKVLIQGESGTGKELIAWAIHHNSDRKGFPYIKLNCAAIPSELLESELFGHRRGSFTGAHADKTGKFIAADGGSLFLDEIGDMSLNLQAKLLRVLEENEVEVIGENIPRKVDVRIIAATNKNLKTLIENGDFREDLYHRLNVINLLIEPLKNRKEDIVQLANFFLKLYCESYNKRIISISRQVEGLLYSYDYPGNVRELRNIIEKAVIYENTNELTIKTMYKTFTSKLDEDDTDTGLLLGTNLKNARKEFEKKFIRNTLEFNDWKIGETAASLEIDRTSLFRKMQELGISK
ncbi:MAG: sigma-54-dependent Fis family transcriptional regulator [Melioribacteraceae bacterium]|nr:sigma-54-dependent Fis family transcriptional regulator [Melioribacteraceae bacterium]